jgi:hypothetical protein
MFRRRWARASACARVHSRRVHRCVRGRVDLSRPSPTPRVFAEESASH